MRTIFAVLWTLLQAGSTGLPATDVTASAIEATKKEAIAKGIIDTAIRTVDAGGHNVGVGIVQRPKGVPGGSILHDQVTEVPRSSGCRHIGDGRSSPNHRDATAVGKRRQYHGAWCHWKRHSGWCQPSIAAGDIVIIPAGTPHAWSEVSRLYTVVRVVQAAWALKCARVCGGGHKGRAEYRERLNQRAA